MDTRRAAILDRTTQYFRDHAPGRHAYLVGGALRNLLLGEPCYDWDIVVDGDAHRLARGLANALGANYAHMHDKASRVIIKPGEGEHASTIITIDIAPLNGSTIEDDLRQRDFTINAIAAPLDDVMPYPDPDPDPDRDGVMQLRRGTAACIDPTRGLPDIHSRLLRAVDGEVFRHDPLRVLRAARLAAQHHLSLDDRARALILRDAALLPTVAPERIHDELYAILALDGATAHLRLLDSLGLLTVLIPEFIPARDMRQPAPHYWDVLEHSLESVGALEHVASMLATPDAHLGAIPGDGGDFGNDILPMLREAEQQGIFSFDALSTPRMKMAALLHDIGKPATCTVDADGNIHFYGHPQAGAALAQQITRRLSASAQDRRLAQQIAAHHMRPGQLGQADLVTPRAIRRYFVDLGPSGILVALFSLADHLATFGPQPLTAAWERHLSVVQLLLHSYVRERERFLPPLLLTADELMHRLKLEPGPLVGELLDQLSEAQAEGRVHSREEALWLAEELLNQSGG